MNSFRSAARNTFRGHHILEALILTLCADDPEILKNIRRRKVILRAEKFIGDLPLTYTLLAKFALYLIEYAVPPLAWKVRPFSRLSFEDRLTYLESWWASPFYSKRMIFKMLTSLCVPEIFSERRLLKKLGYGPSLTHRKEASRAAALASPEKSPEAAFCALYDTSESFDAIVIGSGAGGAVVAKELSEAGWKVAIVEEGVRHHVSSHTDQAHEAVIRLYRDRGFTTTFGNPVIAIPLGRAVGGTTLVNSGTCFRTPASVMKSWRDELGLKSLTEENFNPHFEKVEKTINVEDARFEVMCESNRIVHELLKTKGMTGHPLKRNVRNCDGCGFCCYGCPSAAKQSTDISYIPLALAAGAKLFTGIRFEKFIKQGNKILGIQGHYLDHDYHPTNRAFELRAKVVIIAAGSLITPHLLRQNGIATSNRNLGRHLSIHPATKVFAQMPHEIRSWEGTPQAYYYEGYKDRGVTFEGIFVPPDIAAMTVPFVGRKLLEFMKDYRFMASFGFLISDTSSGKVVNLPFVGRSVLYNLQKKDVEKVKLGVVFLARLFLEGGARKVVTLIHGHTELYSMADVERLEKAKISAQDIECMAFHPLGTCRMGTTPKTGVVDENFKVFGYEGLYICDGSVIPTSLGVNPQVSIMAFATHCAKLLEKSDIRTRGPY